MKRDTVIFCLSWFEAISALPEEEQGGAALAILGYAFKGDDSCAKNAISKAMLAMAKPIIDLNNQRYENGCKGGEYGVLGGRPRKPQENPKETPRKPQGNPKKTPKKPQENPKETPVFSPPTPPSIYDNDNDNDISSLSLSLSPYEKEEDTGGVTATEREIFLEIFYFRNSKYPEQEVKRFVNHYEANGWCRNNSNRPVKNKSALAKSWKFEDEAPRYDATTLKILNHKFWPAILEIGDRKIVLALHLWLRKIEILEDGRLHIFVGDKKMVEIINHYHEVLSKYLGDSWKYGVLKV